MNTSDAIPSLLNQLSALDCRGDQYAARFVEVLLRGAEDVGASDIHFRPCGAEIQIRLRVDGLLTELGNFPAGETTHIVTRLKVLAELLTYQTELPQEGRIRFAQTVEHSPIGVVHRAQMRLSTFPTIHGEQAVVRLFGGQRQFQFVSDLGLPPADAQRLQLLLTRTSGAIVIAGPAGSGKTTTLYASLRELTQTAHGARSIHTLEDPVEMILPGTTQSQIHERAGLDFATGLRAMLRQDPEVMVVGELREPATALLALQAALTGQLVLTTFHAGSAVEAIGRLSDMSLEPYLLRSGLLAVLCQRLVRKMCACAVASTDDADGLGLPVTRWRRAVGCEACHGSGYAGRMLLAELLAIEGEALAQAILSRADTRTLQTVALRGGFRTMETVALEAVNAGQTTGAEIRRVLGFEGVS